MKCDYIISGSLVLLIFFISGNDLIQPGFGSCFPQAEIKLP